MVVRSAASCFRLADFWHEEWFQILGWREVPRLGLGRGVIYWMLAVKGEWDTTVMGEEGME